MPQPDKRFRIDATVDPKAPFVFERATLDLRPGVLAVSVPSDHVARTLLGRVWAALGKPDDAGCDWATDDEGGTWIMFDEPQQVSDDDALAALVDAANVLLYGDATKIRQDKDGDAEGGRS